MWVKYFCIEPDGKIEQYVARNTKGHSFSEMRRAVEAHCKFDPFFELGSFQEAMAAASRGAMVFRVQSRFFKLMNSPDQYADIGFPSNIFFAVRQSVAPAIQAANSVLQGVQTEQGTLETAGADRNAE